MLVLNFCVSGNISPASRRVNDFRVVKLNNMCINILDMFYQSFGKKKKLTVFIRNNNCFWLLIRPLPKNSRI